MKHSVSILGSILTTGMLGLSITASADEHPATAQQSDSQTSTAQVQISNGRLSLDKIPSFGFTNQGSSNEYRLHLIDPGQRDNSVQVTDYRNEDLPHRNERPGWSLNVSADQISDGSQLELSSHDSSNSLSTRPVSLDSSHPTQEIMGSNINDNVNKDKGYGVNKVSFNDPSDAYLSIPNVAPQKYTVNVNWELNTQVNSDVNNAN